MQSIDRNISRSHLANTLCFGCRSATKDRHYHHEWEAYEKRGELVYRAACSRDGPEGTARVYVQDLIREDGKQVAELLLGGAWVFISGSVLSFGILELS